MLSKLIAFLILIADIWAIIQIMKSNAPTVEKILWVVLVFVLPLVGLIIWYFFGPKA